MSKFVLVNGAYGEEIIPLSLAYKIRDHQGKCLLEYQNGAYIEIDISITDLKYFLNSDDAILDLTKNQDRSAKTTPFPF
ncbi:hypothetical protein J7554_08725 [Wohlfahrtiimonas chitiniclastica]|uniref:hypothetical protein n=1 Tax=Wohlfahrtiimonas chitiniclastica TaxID=400946 RepID=UPI001BCCC381|nr:hypothetical protein [Wohlfahrtiimonas chitiniclastica]MBS7829210.1 hypothetical protein [Wohlfahrtiimonas chitiniclastica]